MKTNIYLLSLLFLLTINKVIAQKYSESLDAKVFIYKGKVGDLPANFTLIFNLNGDKPKVLGSYYYPTLKPTQVYSLVGYYGFAPCFPGQQSNKKALIDQNLLIREFTNDKHTANLFLCPKNQDNINELTGYLTNTDKNGKSYSVTLKLISPSKF